MFREQKFLSELSFMYKKAQMLLLGLYVLLRGPTQVLIEPTRLIYRRIHPPKGSVKALTSPVKLLIECRQYVHRIRYERWYMLDKRQYNYGVDVTVIDGDTERQKIPTTFYPHLCAKWLVWTFYPHVCAVEAHMDNVLKHLDEEILRAV